MERIKNLVVLFLMFWLFSGCADFVSFEDAKDIEPVGFFYGLWHGFILAFSFIISLFDDNVTVYAIYNNGDWYDFGFLVGVNVFFSSAAGAGEEKN